jgi:hypothetical protein
LDFLPGVEEHGGASGEGAVNDVVRRRQTPRENGRWTLHKGKLPRYDKRERQCHGGARKEGGTESNT